MRKLGSKLIAITFAVLTSVNALAATVVGEVIEKDGKVYFTEFANSTFPAYEILWETGTPPRQICFSNTATNCPRYRIYFRERSKSKLLGASIEGHKETLLETYSSILVEPKRR